MKVTKPQAVIAVATAARISSLKTLCIVTKPQAVIAVATIDSAFQQ